MKLAHTVFLNSIMFTFVIQFWHQRSVSLGKLNKVSPLCRFSKEGRKAGNSHLELFKQPCMPYFLLPFLCRRTTYLVLSSTCRKRNKVVKKLLLFQICNFFQMFL
jgi:hypothetical protein